MARDKEPYIGMDDGGAGFGSAPTLVADNPGLVARNLGKQYK